MNFRILRAIFIKDLRSLAALAVLTAVLFAGDVVLMRLELLPVWESFRQPLLLLSCAVLIFAVFQLDSAVSLVDDWLCRPVPRKELLTAKLLLVLAAIYVPRVIATFIIDLGLGLSFNESLAEALLLQDRYFQLVLPILLLTAILTRTLVQGIAVLIALFVCIFMIPTPLIHAPGPMDAGIGEALINAGAEWIATTPAKIVPILLVVLGFWLLYWRKRVLHARILLGLTAALTLFFVVLPMWLLPWKTVFALQAATLAKADTAGTDITDRIRLRNPRVCFPAARIDTLTSDAAFNAALQASGLRMWSDEALRAAGPDAVAFLTRIEPRGLPLDWRVKLNYVQADYDNGGSTALYSLRPASYITDGHSEGLLSHAWMLPTAALQPLKSPETSLRLRYSLTLLKPRNYDLATDGTRHALPDLGFCSAAMSATGDRIEVDCFSASSPPAQITAELNDIPASRVYGAADFSPAWTQWPYGQHVKLAIGSPGLARHDSIRLTAWDVAGYLDESLTLPGILGADLQTCPVPTAENSSFQKSRWRDAAPHETYSIGVDEGVQLEVLDFGGTGLPIVLLPGLGATAHSYDDVGPLLARKHRVIAVTRRGAGYSSRPDSGFDTAHLAQDVLGVMDEMHIQRALLIGSSIAGEELTWLGGHHPERFAGLVYLDAAYDRSQDAAQSHSHRLRELLHRLPPEPPIPPAALRDYDAMSALLDERGHARYPEGELIALLQVNNPYLAGVPNIDARTQQAITAAIQAPDYAAIRIPALAIYAFSDPRERLPGWYDLTDQTLLANVAEIDRIAQVTKRRNIELFRRTVEKGQVLEMHDATHYIIQSNQQQVLPAIEKFAEGL